MQKIIFLSAIFSTLFQSTFGLKLAVCHTNEGNYIFGGDSCVIQYQKIEDGEKLSVIVERKNSADIKKLGFLDSEFFQVPAEIFAKFKNLDLFDMINQNVQVIAPGTFENAGNLKKLYLNGNQIRLLNADTFKGAENLETIELPGNKLESMPERIFRKLKKLRYINFSSNFLTSIPLKLFEYNKLMYKINLENNEINSFSIATFKNLPNLKDLNYKNNICIHEEYFIRIGQSTDLPEIDFKKIEKEVTNCSLNYLQLENEKLKKIVMKILIHLAKQRRSSNKRK
jgi:Leucine-rich repeat (LRR) protein